MVATVQFTTYQQQGKKLSFADWIADQSVNENLFSSMIGKQTIDQTEFSWQTDYLRAPMENAHVEGSDATYIAPRATSVLKNNTQIIRTTCQVSDSANHTANYGRGKELMYQLEKAGKEAMRDKEWAFLNNVTADSGSGGTGSSGSATARKMKGFMGLIAAKDAVCPDTGAVVHKYTGTADAFTEAQIFSMMTQLFIAGSEANVVMIHPQYAKAFSMMQESPTAPAQRVRIFENTPVFSSYVNTIISHEGVEYKIVVNRQMPTDRIYFFNPKDFDEMAFRRFEKTQLAKTGSSEKYMVEGEYSLRLRHPFAAGVLVLKTNSSVYDVAEADAEPVVARATRAKK